MRLSGWVITAFVLLPWVSVCSAGIGRPWPRHTVDDASRGADGVRLADANGDGLPDVVTGWEEGGVTRVCLDPGPARAKSKWPAVTVGRTPSVEDAVFVDLDADGAVDVVTSCEGRTRAMFVHWAPHSRERYLDPTAWRTEPLPASEGRMAWMFCLPMQVDGRRGIDLVAAGKGRGAAVGWFESPEDPRDLGAWTWHPLCPAGWTMSLMAADMDADGDADVVVTDRKGERSGCYWLQRPNAPDALAKPWRRHKIGGGGEECMFACLADLDHDGLTDVLVATKPRTIVVCRRMDESGRAWEHRPIRLPESAGTAKAVAVGDLDGKGGPEIVFTCEGASDGRYGCMYLAVPETAPGRVARDISGPEGTKFDLVELLDLDGDGDLDVLTCAEQPNLGVFWYENPMGSPRAKPEASNSIEPHAEVRGDTPPRTALPGASTPAGPPANRSVASAPTSPRPPDSPAVPPR